VTPYGLTLAPAEKSAEGSRKPANEWQKLNYQGSKFHDIYSLII
jgi:hypothetical protein